VPLAPEVVHALKVWKLQCPPSPDDLVFPGPDGRPMHRGTVLRGGLYPALRRAGLRKVDMHSLRHSFASGLLAQGTPVTEVQRYLGHADAVITLRVYAHRLREVRTDAVARFTSGVLAGAWTPFGHQAVGDKAVDAVSS